jgi:hypothetical protein
VTYVRKVRTASGATAVQIAVKQGGRRTIIEHVGSAHTDSELAALMQLARGKLHAGQEELDLGLVTPGTSGVGPSVITAKRSRRLIEASRPPGAGSGSTSSTTRLSSSWSWPGSWSRPR